MPKTDLNASLPVTRFVSYFGKAASSFRESGITTSKHCNHISAQILYLRFIWSRRVESLKVYCPEYLPAFDHVMRKSRSGHMFNMFIMSNEKSELKMQTAHGSSIL